jgi:hypothetical protein
MTEMCQARFLLIVQPVGGMLDPNNARKCFPSLTNPGFSLLRAVTALSW